MLSPLSSLLMWIVMFQVFTSGKQLKAHQTSSQCAYRSDNRCGTNYLAPNGQPGTCPKRCCSGTGLCGDSSYHCDCSSCTDYRGGKMAYVKVGLAAIGTGAAAVALAPVAVTALGFGAGGIVAGSVASSLMSTAAIAGGTGGVAPMVAGGIVAACQSAGAAGLASSTMAAVGATGAAVGAGVVIVAGEEEQQ